MSSLSNFFKEDDIAAIKLKAKTNPRIIDKINEEHAPFRKKLYIQKSALATWGHYYMCPKHSVKLTFNYDDPKHHVCPIDGEVFTKEPYDGGWWMSIAFRNSRVCFEAAALYLATEDHTALKLSKEIILSYAENYENYEVHGDIPYNNPGRICSQVLDEATIFTSLARAYAIIKSELSESERRLAEEKLFAPGAEHLIKYMTPQLHNHEIAICSAIGLIGLATNDKKFLEIAVNEKYGLKYQLDHALLSDGLWFEGSVGYHLFALKHIMDYEGFARYTEYSLFGDSHYREKLVRMLEFPLQIATADFHLPMINDCEAYYSNALNTYEYGYSAAKTDKILKQLYLAIGEGERREINYLLFGEANLPKEPSTDIKNYLSDSGSSLAVIHGDDGRYLLFKASPFGGEHDHYDRLSLSFSAFGKNLCRDLGTAVGYSAPLHYAYYKNTASHNTVVIDGKNMPPALTRVKKYQPLDDGCILLDAEVTWDGNYHLPDSFTIKAWDDEAYFGTYMRRQILWCGSYFIDVFSVKSDNRRRKEWVLHTDGEPTNSCANAKPMSPFTEGAQAKLHSLTYRKGKGTELQRYLCDGVFLDCHFLAEGFTVIEGKGPDNPSVSDICYLLLRSEEPSPVYACVIEAHEGNSVIESVNIEKRGDEIAVTVKENSGKLKKFIPIFD